MRISSSAGGSNSVMFRRMFWNGEADRSGICPLPGIGLDVFLKHLAPHHRAVHIALAVHANAFGSAMFFGGRFHILDEVFDGPILRAADSDSFFPAGFVLTPRFRVGHIHRVVFSDEDSAGAAELSP